MSTYSALLATFFVGYALSGAAMYIWLRPWAQRPVLGAFAFMVAPYHVFNFYSRGAVAEFMATIFIPLVMAGLWRQRRTNRDGFVLTALAYAGLVGTHLPLALLVSVFLIGPLLLVEAYKSPRDAVSAALALLLGLALAAIYWFPAVLLEPYRDAAKLWAKPVLQPSNWSFWNPGFRTSPGYIAILVVGAALALPLVSLIVRERSRWAMYGLACVLLAIGVLPMLWSLPLIRSVQFPFRLFPLAEFALATAIATAALRPAALAVALAPLVAISAFIITAVPLDQGISARDVAVLYADVPENLPPGDRPYSWPSRWALEVARSHLKPQVMNGVTIEPVFYFPAWEVRCHGDIVPSFPAKDVRLLAYRGVGCERRLGMTAAQTMGAAISLLGLLSLALVGLLSLRARWRIEDQQGAR
jgi:hypothetical protein